LVVFRHPTLTGERTGFYLTGVGRIPAISISKARSQLTWIVTDIGESTSTINPKLPTGPEGSAVFMMPNRV